VRVRGFEFDGRWSPIERLWITFSGAATMLATSAIPRRPFDRLAMAAGSNINGISAPLYVNLSGQRMTPASLATAPFHPIPSTSASTTKHPLGRALANWGLRQASDGVRLQQSRLENTRRSCRRVLELFPATTVLLADQRWHRPQDDDGRYSFNLWVKNLADTRYIIGQSIAVRRPPAVSPSANRIRAPSAARFA